MPRKRCVRGCRRSEIETTERLVAGSHRRLRPVGHFSTLLCVLPHRKPRDEVGLAFPDCPRVNSRFDGGYAAPASPKLAHSVLTHWPLHAGASHGHWLPVSRPAAPERRTKRDALSVTVMKHSLQRTTRHSPTSDLANSIRFGRRRSAWHSGAAVDQGAAAPCAESLCCSQFPCRPRFLSRTPNCKVVTHAWAAEKGLRRGHGDADGDRALGPRA